MRLRPPPSPTLFPYTTLFRSADAPQARELLYGAGGWGGLAGLIDIRGGLRHGLDHLDAPAVTDVLQAGGQGGIGHESLDLADRKSTRLNSSHVKISYAVFCLK